MFSFEGSVYIVFFLFVVVCFWRFLVFVGVPYLFLVVVLLISGGCTSVVCQGVRIIETNSRKKTRKTLISPSNYG